MELEKKIKANKSEKGKERELRDGDVGGGESVTKREKVKDEMIEAAGKQEVAASYLCFFDSGYTYTSPHLCLFPVLPFCLHSIKTLASKER